MRARRLWYVAVTVALAACGGGGGGGDDPPPQQTNPTPAVTSVAPTAVSAGGSAFTLTVNGTNFIAGSVVQWNGGNRATSFVSASQVTAAIINGATPNKVTSPGTGSPNRLLYSLIDGGGGGGDTTPPTTPTSVTATASSSSAIGLSWTAASDSGGSD